jgi:Holliday junction resolvasome RuvABC endonuclease subunit
LIGGLDPSTKRIGYCSPDGRVHSIVLDYRYPQHPTEMDMARRCHALVAGLERRLNLFPPQPELMVIEGPFFAHPNTSARLDELRGCVRSLMISRGIWFVEVAPKNLKAFATGDGAADKSKMLHAARCAAELEGTPAPRNDDEADAWWLRRMGRVGCGLVEPDAGRQIEALAGSRVAWPDSDLALFTNDKEMR